MVVLLSACATNPPQNIDNVCSIFKEKSKWYKQAKRSSNKWHTPIPVTMAILHQESSFNAKIKPPRKRFLWIFPGSRPTSAYGYAQVINETWEWYQRETKRKGASRKNFSDAVDFIGWYNNISHRNNGIAYDDAYRLYLAYHEGHNGFKRGTFEKKPWLKQVAQKVSNRSNTYSVQLSSCESSLQRGHWWWPFS